MASDDYSLKDVNFINVQLEGACLVRMNLEKCTMAECKLSGAHLNNAILREAKLRDVDLEGTHLAGAILEGVILNNAVLIGVDLTGADLKNANLTKAILEIATLKNASLVGAILEGANLQDAKLEGAILEDAILEHANLRMAKLIEADLRRADLRDANLTAAILQGANLEGANLEGANLEGADLRGVLLFSIDSKKFQKDLDKGTISKDLQQEFEKNGISVSQNTNVSIEEKDHRWLIDDKDNERTYTVRKEEWLNMCKDTDSDLREIFSVDSKKFQRDLDKGSISKNLQQEFEKNGISVSQNTNVSIEEKDHRWLIDDKDNERTYTVRKEEWLNVCKETKFDFMGIKKAKKWQNAIFDNDVRQKLTNPQN